MTHIVADVDGYVGDLATSRGWADLAEVLLRSGVPALEELAENGYSTEPEDVVEALGNLKGLPEKLDSTRLQLQELARTVDGVLIVTDGVAFSEGAGHPFHGNRWTGGIGLTPQEERAINFWRRTGFDLNFQQSQRLQTIILRQPGLNTPAIVYAPGSGTKKPGMTWYNGNVFTHATRTAIAGQVRINLPKGTHLLSFEDGLVVLPMNTQFKAISPTQWQVLPRVGKYAKPTTFEAILELFDDSAVKTLYVSRAVLNADEINEWAKAQGFTTTIPPKDMHVTVAFSRDAVDWDELTPEGNLLEAPTLGYPTYQRRLVKALGSDGAVVLQFDSPELHARWMYYREHGASWDHENYFPHITVTYNPPSTLDLDKVRPFTGVIRLGPEKMSEVAPGWADKIKEQADLYKALGEGAYAPGHPFWGNQWSNTISHGKIRGDVLVRDRPAAGAVEHKTQYFLGGQHIATAREKMGWEHVGQGRGGHMVHQTEVHWETEGLSKLLGHHPSELPTFHSPVEIQGHIPSGSSVKGMLQGLLDMRSTLGFEDDAEFEGVKFFATDDDGCVWRTLSGHAVCIEGSKKGQESTTTETGRLPLSERNSVDLAEQVKRTMRLGGAYQHRLLDPKTLFATQYVVHKNPLGKPPRFDSKYGLPKGAVAAETPDGKLHLLDGHHRVDGAIARGDPVYPVAVVRVSGVSVAPVKYEQQVVDYAAAQARAEKAVDFVDIKSTLDALEERSKKALRRTLKDITDGILARVRRSKDHKKLIKEFKLPMKGQLRDDMRSLLQRAWDAGNRDAGRERRALKRVYAEEHIFLTPSDVHIDAPLKVAGKQVQPQCSFCDNVAITLLGDKYLCNDCASKMDARQFAEGAGHPFHGNQWVTRAQEAVQRAPSVRFGFEPEWTSESRNHTATGKPGSVVERPLQTFKTSGGKSGEAREFSAYDAKGKLAGVLSIATKGEGQGAFKIVVRDSAQRQGVGAKLLDAARRAGVQIDFAANRYTPSGRALTLSWLDKQKGAAYEQFSAEHDAIMRVVYEIALQYPNYGKDSILSIMLNKKEFDPETVRQVVDSLWASGRLRANYAEGTGHPFHGNQWMKVPAFVGTFGEAEEALKKNGISHAAFLTTSRTTAEAKALQLATGHLGGKPLIVEARVPLSEVEKIRKGMTSDAHFSFTRLEGVPAAWIHGVHGVWGSVAAHTDTQVMSFYIPLAYVDKQVQHVTAWQDVHEYAGPASVTPRSALQWLRAKAFYITDLLSNQLTEGARGVLVNGVKSGMSTQEMVDKLTDLFMPYLGDGTVIEDSDVLMPWRLETVVRTNNTDAYNHGRLTDMMDPAVRPFLKAIKYSAVLDTRTTEVCRYLNGFLFKPGDSAVEDLIPPNHYNCRSILTPMVVGQTVNANDFIGPAQIGHAKTLADKRFLEAQGAWKAYKEPDEEESEEASHSFHDNVHTHAKTGTEITLVRHGATDMNDKNVVRGWRDVPLNDDGRASAEKEGKALKDKKIDVLVSSDFCRATETGKIIRKHIGDVPMEETEALRPWHVGEHTGKDSGKVGEVLADYAKNKPDKKLKGGESFNDFKNRFLTGVEKIVKKHAGKHILLVTHHRGDMIMRAWEKKGMPKNHEIDIDLFLDWKKGIEPGDSREVEVKRDFMLENLVELQVQSFNQERTAQQELLKKLEQDVKLGVTTLRDAINALSSAARAPTQVIVEPQQGSVEMDIEKVSDGKYRVIRKVKKEA